jgi:type I restriction enzyme R subunit
MSVPSLLEKRASQTPALHLLANLGYTILTPGQALQARYGRRSNPLLETVLDSQLRKLNRIRTASAEYLFTDSAIQGAVRALKELPFQGLIQTSESVFDLVSLGKSFEQTIEGVTRGHSLRYIDWENPGNNAFHAVAEFEIEQVGSCRPDMVLFVNGIPFAAIECKGPGVDDGIEQAISQHLRNQTDAEVPAFYSFLHLLLVMNARDGKYATVGTPAEYWSIWREQHDEALSKTINKFPSPEVIDAIFPGDFGDDGADFLSGLQEGSREVTGQDLLLSALCRPERLLELTRFFVLFDAGEKKIARYQQFFAVRRIMERVHFIGTNGAREGGVVWHTQGSGKSLTMVMLAKALALDQTIAAPRIVLVTDRVDLDDQIYGTFRSCGKEPIQARSGTHLIDLINGSRDAIITSVINKFEAACRRRDVRNDSPDIFVLVDEAHRTQHGSLHAMMRDVFPCACYLGFTGTPLMHEEKSTMSQFGGIIEPSYTMDDAVRDHTVVPLLYESRQIEAAVNREPLDEQWRHITRGLTVRENEELKHRSATRENIVVTDQVVYMTAYDISSHFAENWKGTFAKGQVVVESKAIALKFKEFFDQIGKITSEVIISAPDNREGTKDVYRGNEDKIVQFWREQMAKYRTERDYNRTIINAFKNEGPPELLIVVDKLLTGFDVPRNTILYVCRKLSGHTLLQAIARVNRLFPGKDFGYIIDYGDIGFQLHEAMSTYRQAAALEDYDEQDVTGVLHNLAREVERLPGTHTEVWACFRGIRNRHDLEAFERCLADDEQRDHFYEVLSEFSRTLANAKLSQGYRRRFTEEKIRTFERDFVFFQKLRRMVRSRYSDELDFRKYEPRVQQLLNQHVTAHEVTQLVEPVNIFDREAFDRELSEKKSDASRADTIAHRTKKTIAEKFEQDPVFYRRFSEMLEEAIRAFREQRISAAEYLRRTQGVMESVLAGGAEDVPAELRHNETARAYFRIVEEVLRERSGAAPMRLGIDIALAIVRIITTKRIVDWKQNHDVLNAMRNAMEDLILERAAAARIDLSFDQIDAILERSLAVAKLRLPNE